MKKLTDEQKLENLKNERQRIFNALASLDDHTQALSLITARNKLQGAIEVLSGEVEEKQEDKNEDTKSS